MILNLYYGKNSVVIHKNETFSDIFNKFTMSNISSLYMPNGKFTVLEVLFWCFLEANSIRMKLYSQ